MEIGIIGVGMIGGTLARLLSERGHGVQVGTRSPNDPRLATLPPGVGCTTAEGAARFGIATIVAVPFAAWPDLAQSLESTFDGRVILDTSNAIPSRDGPAAEDALASGEGSGAAVARLLPRARVVKAFSSVHFATLATTTGAEPPVAIPLAGDDPGAVAIAAGVVAAAGFAPVPAGPMRAAARFDFGSPLFNVALTEAEWRIGPRLVDGEAEDEGHHNQLPKAAYQSSNGYGRRHFESAPSRDHELTLGLVGHLCSEVDQVRGNDGW